jgi:hypothetical protein
MGDLPYHSHGDHVPEGLVPLGNWNKKESSLRWKKREHLEKDHIEEVGSAVLHFDCEHFWPSGAGSVN